MIHVDVLNVFPLCRFCLSLKKDVPLHMTKFKSPLPQHTLCQFKFVLYSALLWRFFKKSLYRQYLPLGRGVTVHLIKFDFPSLKNTPCQDWLEFNKVSALGE